MGAPPQPDLRFDYEKTIELFKLLADIRFKLLAFVPTIVGAAIALIGDNKPPGVMIGVGALGLCGTLGVLLYELRNSELYNQAIHRAKFLEGAQQFPESVEPIAGKQGRWPKNGGVFSERHRGGYDFLGRIPIKHDVGLGFVYSAAIAGWAYLIVRGVTAALALSGSAAFLLPFGIALAAGLLTWIEVFLHDSYQFKPVRPRQAYDPPRDPSHARKKAFLFAALLIAGLIALGAAVPAPAKAPLPQTQNSAAGGPGSRGASGQGTPTDRANGPGSKPPESAQTSGWWQLAMGIAILTTLAGIALLLFGKNRKLAAGVATVGLAGATSLPLLGRVQFKFDNEFKVENKAEINPSLQFALSRLGSRAPEKIGDIRGFNPGESEVPAPQESNETNPDVAAICESWNPHAKDGGLLMLVGSTDRTPLSPEARRRYESNTGLARARAETAKLKIQEQCKIPAEQMFTAITGPSYTPALGQGDPPLKGRLDDRHVEAWAFWNTTAASFDVKLGKSAEKKESSGR